MRDRAVVLPLIVLRVNDAEQIMYFFIPIAMIVVGINLLIINKRRSPSLGKPLILKENLSLRKPPSLRKTPSPRRPIRPDGRDRPYSSRPSVIFSRQPGTQEPEEKQEVGLTADVKPYSYDNAQPLTEAWLLIDGCGIPEKSYKINGIVISIGRSDDNDIVLNDRTVSLRHAKIRLEGEKYFLYDLASTNGTRVNGRKITKISIKAGDVLEMGLTRMAFKTRENGDGLRKQRPAVRHQQLSGNLEYFDLPFIVQTLAASERTGTLTIIDQLERVFATLYFEAGDVLFAKLGHLRGEEAFYQLFQSPVQNAFSFTNGLPSSEFEDEDEIGTNTAGLLMEATRQQDELKVIKATYADANRVFRPQWEMLLWGNEETRDLAQEIWARLQRGETIAQMVREITTGEYRIYKILSLMHSNGFVE